MTRRSRSRVSRSSTNGGGVPGGDDPVNHPEDAGAVGCRDGVDALVEHGGVGVAQQGDRPLVVDAAVVRPADELVHDGEGVAHGATAGAHHEGEDAGADLDALGLAQVAEVASRTSGGTRRREWWVRERMVPMTFSGSVVAKMNFTCAGGSSTSLSSALKPCAVTMWASSRMKIL